MMIIERIYDSWSLEVLAGPETNRWLAVQPRATLIKITQLIRVLLSFVTTSIRVVSILKCRIVNHTFIFSRVHFFLLQIFAQLFGFSMLSLREINSEN